MAADSTPEEEVRRLERHYSVNPEGLVFARLADAYRRCGRRERALELLREGLERHPDYATGHLIEGRTLREEGRAEEAVESFRRVLDLDAENLVALRSLAELATERGDLDDARRWADRLERADPFASFSPAEAASEAADGDREEPSRPADGDGAGTDREAAGATGGPEEGGRPSAAPTGPGDPGALPGEDGLASEIAAMADDGWWGGSRGADREPERDGEVATETMAHLYAQQGLYEEAAEVYRRLLDRRPGDGELRHRLEEMEQRAAGDGELDEAGSGDGDASPAPGRNGGEALPSPDAVSARDHFRNLLRGRARVGQDRAPEGDAGSAEGSRRPAEEPAG